MVVVGSGGREVWSGVGCWFLLESHICRNKNMEIVDVFTDFYNINDKPWKSSVILRVKRKTLDIFEDFACSILFILFILFIVH